MIVADANLLVGLCLEGEPTRMAEAVFATDPAWAVPLLWRSEMRGALAKYVQDRRMGMDQALVSMLMAEETVHGHEYTVNSRKVLELAAASGCPANECEYVALAMDLDVPLVTADKQILKAFPQAAVPLEQFVRRK